MRKLSFINGFAMVLVLLFAAAAVAMPVGPSAGAGVKGGMNLAKMSELEEITGIGEPSNDVKTGFVGGAFARFALGPINAQVEGLYSVRGVQGDIPGLGEYELNQHYFDIPLLLNFEFPLPAPVSPYVYAGPCWSYLLKAEDGDGTDIKDQMKDNEFSLLFGVGMRATKLHFDIRYQLGLTELEEEDTAASTLRDAKTRNISFFVGYELIAF